MYNMNALLSSVNLLDALLQSWLLFQYDLIGCGCCGEGDTCCRSCCCRDSGGRSAVHHGYFQEGNHGSNEQEGVALW